MRRTMWMLGVGAIILMVSAFMVTTTAEDDMVLDACGEKKSAVTFPHEAHKALTECVTCHHTSEGLAEGGEAEKCTSCHLNPEDAATPSCAEMSPSKNPYHKLCIGCHKTEAKGPAKCNDCHPKE